MSDYLLSRLQTDPLITIHFGSAISELHGAEHLAAVTVQSAPNDERTLINTRALFLIVGARPNTTWLSDLVAFDEKGFVKTGQAAGADSLFATSQPGIFAVGDVRSGSVKRVASSVGEGSVVISKVWDYLQPDTGSTRQQRPANLAQPIHKNAADRCHDPMP